MPTPIFQGLIQDKKLKIKDKQTFELWLGSLEGKEIDLIVRRHRKPRTTRQNAYYWVICTFIGNELGYTPDEMHITFKSLFLKEMKKGLPVIRSTTKLSTLEFTEYVENVISKCYELGLTVPNPEDRYNHINFIN